METAKMKAFAPLVLAGLAAFLLYRKSYSYALYVAVALFAWLGYEAYEKKSTEVSEEA
jgi:uncharacterized membrane protein YebE (DUF533 family)